MEEAVREALKARVSSSDSVKHILMNMSEEKRGGDIASLRDWLVFAPADVSIYDRVV